MNCAAASAIYEQKEGEAMTGNWQEQMLAALAMLGAGLEGMGLEMPGEHGDDRASPLEELKRPPFLD
jgi:hypothetical protein